MEKLTINFENPAEAVAICPQGSPNLALLEEACGVKVVVRDNFIRLWGPAPAVAKAGKIIREAREALPDNGAVLPAGELERLIELADTGGGVPRTRIRVATSRGYVRPRTAHQEAYVRAIEAHEIVFSIGPAGTGKTYLAVAMAVSALLEGNARRLILTRPALEAGERLGFLPGDIAHKISPYLRPLYDALYDLLDADRISRYEEQGIIEVAPLAFMRGRTLNDAFIILDEAQNSTGEQMKMFLTRLGYNSRMVITGDITQTDLPPDKPSGLLQVRDILSGVAGISFVELGEEDVVRHALVQRIVRAYEESNGRS